MRREKIALIFGPRYQTLLSFQTWAVIFCFCFFSLPYSTVYVASHLHFKVICTLVCSRMKVVNFFFHRKIVEIFLITLTKKNKLVIYFGNFYEKSAGIFTIAKVSQFLVYFCSFFCQLFVIKTDAIHLRR